MDKDSSIFMPYFYTKSLSNMIRQVKLSAELLRMFLVNGQGVLIDCSVAISALTPRYISLELIKIHFTPFSTALIIQNGKDNILFHTASAAILFGSRTFLLTVVIIYHRKVVTARVSSTYMKNSVLKLTKKFYHSRSIVDKDQLKLFSL